MKYMLLIYGNEAALQSASAADLEEMHAAYVAYTCLLYTSPSPRDRTRSRMPSSA